MTTSPERANHILAANRRLGDGKGSGLFLTTDGITLAAHGDLLTLPMQSGRGLEAVRLMDAKFLRQLTESVAAPYDDHRTADPPRREMWRLKHAGYAAIAEVSECSSRTINIIF